MKSKQHRQGICRLTGNTGTYVDAHLIPKALTRPEEPGLPLMQGGRGQPPRRRWSSWYDPELVTREGEDILAALDTWAISEFRKQKLIWSGWGPALKLSWDHTELPGTDWGIRKVVGLDQQKARLFMLSLLWRAAASKLPEFSEIEIPKEELERLRLMILENNPNPLDFYPASLIQLSTLGTIHNMSPVAQTKVVPSLSDLTEKHIPIFRFYFDGLIVHFICQSSDIYETKALGPLIVGQEDELVINTVKYESSFEKENLEIVREESSRATMQLFRDTGNPAILRKMFW